MGILSRDFLLRLAFPAVLLLFTLNMLLLSGWQSKCPSSTTVILADVAKGGKGEDLSKSDERNAFRQLQRVSSSRDTNGQSGGASEPKTGAGRISPVTDLEQSDVDQMILELLNDQFRPIFPQNFTSRPLKDLTRNLGRAIRTKATQLLAYMKRNDQDSTLNNWQLFHRHIRRFSLYDSEDPVVDGLLHDMTTRDITEIDENDGGTQLKLNLKFSDGGRGVFKPMRYHREVEADENRYIFDDIERHIAEIAAFHLDRILGFNKVPPTVGRIVNLTSEIRPLVPRSIEKTFFTSPAGNICFYGECDYYCGSAHAFCGHPDMIEGAIMSYLPSRLLAKRKSWYQPYRRSYSKSRKAEWETDDSFCDRMKKEEPFTNGKLLYDLIDVHIFDFLTGNKDRHSIITFREWGNFSFPLLYDNGRGFGRQNYDAMSILAPLRQCCEIRRSTLLKLVKLYTGPEKLSSLMEESLKVDPIAPVLLPGHLHALDRRLVKVLKTVADCHNLQQKSYNKIIKVDPY